MVAERRKLGRLQTGSIRRLVGWKAAVRMKRNGEPVTLAA